MQCQVCNVKIDKTLKSIKYCSKRCTRKANRQRHLNLTICCGKPKAAGTRCKHISKKAKDKRTCEPYVYSISHNDTLLYIGQSSSLERYARHLLKSFTFNKHKQSIRDYNKPLSIYIRENFKDADEARASLIFNDKLPIIPIIAKDLKTQAIYSEIYYIINSPGTCNEALYIPSNNGRSKYGFDTLNLTTTTFKKNSGKTIRTTRRNYHDIPIDILHKNIQNDFLNKIKLILKEETQLIKLQESVCQTS